MKKLGILDSRKEGLNVWYSLRIRCLASLLSCVEKVAQGQNLDMVFSSCGCRSFVQNEYREEEKRT
jgi:ArsR family transcriptional regulator